MNRLTRTLHRLNPCNAALGPTVIMPDATIHNDVARRSDCRLGQCDRCMGHGELVARFSCPGVDKPEVSRYCVACCMDLKLGTTDITALVDPDWSPTPYSKRPARLRRILDHAYSYLTPHTRTAEARDLQAECVEADRRGERGHAWGDRTPAG